LNKLNLLIQKEKKKKTLIEPLRMAELNQIIKQSELEISKGETVDVLEVKKIASKWK
jgi:hypothetical protein